MRVALEIGAISVAYRRHANGVRKLKGVIRTCERSAGLRQVVVSAHEMVTGGARVLPRIVVKDRQEAQKHCHGSRRQIR